MMKTALKSDFKSKTFCSGKTFIPLKEEEVRYVDFKFYQKFFVILISLSSILIFPESPRELANICESYNSKKLCNVW